MSEENPCQLASTPCKGSNRCLIPKMLWIAKVKGPCILSLGSFTTPMTWYRTPAAATRFYQDDRRFPAPAYEEGSLFWRGADWRTPLPMERLQMMGWPAGAVDHVEGPALKKRQVQNSFIGNGFHLPTLLAVLCFLPGLMASKIPQ